MIAQIKNSELKDSDIPSKLGSWGSDISPFALTFNVYLNMPYEEWSGLLPKIHESYQNNQLMNHSLTEMRACLFLIQRNEHHSGGYTSEPIYINLIRALVEAIRHKVHLQQLD
jgi:hypothetical protein